MAETTHFRENGPNSATLYARARSVLPNGDTRGARWFEPYPFYVASGSGSHITDVDGREFLDLTNNLGVLIHGHAHPDIVRAVQAQAALGSCFALPTESEIELAELLVSRVPSFERVQFTNTGSDAVALATKIARAHTGRSRILKLEGVYHGSYDYAEVSNASTPEHWGNDPRSVPTLPVTPQGVLDEVLVTQANDIEMLARRVERHGDELAAILVDPVPPRCGMRPLEPEYLAALRQAADACGALLVFDEVIALRFGYGGAQSALDCRPDLTALGKIIGGGYPVGAVAGRADVMDNAGRAVGASGTFTANPITMTAGLAGMRALTREKLEALNAAGDRVRAACTAIIERHHAPMQVAGYGSLFSIYFHKRPVTDYRSYYKQPEEVAASNAFHHSMLERGVLLAATCTAFWSTAITEADEAKFLAAFEQAVAGG